MPAPLDQVGASEVGVGWETPSLRGPLGGVLKDWTRVPDYLLS